MPDGRRLPIDADKAIPWVAGETASLLLDYRDARAQLPYLQTGRAVNLMTTVTGDPKLPLR